MSDIVSAAAATLREAARACEGRPPGINERVAERLALLLDMQAEEQDERSDNCSTCYGSALFHDGDPIPFDCPDCVFSEPIGVARAVLGIAAHPDLT